MYLIYIHLRKYLHYITVICFHRNVIRLNFIQIICEICEEKIRLIRLKRPKWIHQIRKSFEAYSMPIGVFKKRTLWNKSAIFMTTKNWRTFSSFFIATNQLRFLLFIQNLTNFKNMIHHQYQSKLVKFYSIGNNLHFDLIIICWRIFCRSVIRLKNKRNISTWKASTI